MKRNTIMNKAYKKVLKDLDNILGEADAALLVTIITKLLIDLSNENDQELRTIEVIVNNYFSSKWDFRKNDFVR